MPVTEIPRRARLDLFTPAERAIREAIIAVESTGCDERLTWAVMALSDAQAWVADFVDGVPVAEHYPRPIAPRPPVSPEVLASLQARVIGRMLGAAPEVCLDVGRAYLASDCGCHFDSAAGMFVPLASCPVHGRQVTP